MARWLADSDIPAVQVFPDVEQPVDVDGRAVTFWRELPAHQGGTYLQVADVIKRVHRLPIPDFLGPLEPFVRLADRIGDAITLTDEDRAWLVEHLADLHGRYNDLPAGLPTSVVHGGAHGGNIAATHDGDAILLDLERFAVGPPEWDLMLAAFDYGSVGWLFEPGYRAFADRYGYHVIHSRRYLVLRDIRELRKMLFAAQLATVAKIPLSLTRRLTGSLACRGGGVPSVASSAPSSLTSRSGPGSAGVSAAARRSGRPRRSGDDAVRRCGHRRCPAGYSGPLFDPARAAADRLLTVLRS